MTAGTGVNVEEELTKKKRKKPQNTYEVPTLLSFTGANRPQSRLFMSLPPGAFTAQRGGVYRMNNMLILADGTFRVEN